MPNRYRYTDRAQWRYLGPAFKGIDEDQYQDTRGAHVCCAGELTWGAPE